MSLVILLRSVGSGQSSVVWSRRSEQRKQGMGMGNGEDVWENYVNKV